VGKTGRRQQWSSLGVCLGEHDHLTHSSHSINAIGINVGRMVVPIKAV
jgi:hypothetical protein